MTEWWPPTEFLNEADPRDCLVGYFIEDKLNYHASIFHKIWDKEVLMEVILHESGFFFFRFCSNQARRAVLDEGSWLFAGRPFILQLWHPKLVLTKDRKSALVKIHNIPVEFWSANGFSHVASAVGKALHADVPTENRNMKRISYAREGMEI